MVALMQWAPMDPAQRPALRAAQPAVWMLQGGQGQHPRAEARDLLRALLAGYLGKSHEKMPLHFVPGQAPCVDLDWQGMALSISMSYSQDLALIALCPGAHIGIDVTEIAPMPDWAQVAKLYLGVESTARLAAIDGLPRDKMFALEWAALEARCKCVGLGLQEWSPARHKRLHADSVEVSTMALSGLRSGLAYALALARDSAR